MIDSFHPAPIPSTVDADGFVLVAGARVPNDWKATPLRARPLFFTTCHHCRELTVATPTVVAVRSEPAIPGGLQYHHVFACESATRCVACEAKHLNHKDSDT